MSDTEAGENEHTECTICTDEFAAVEEVVEFPVCKHFFHPHCIADWFQIARTCPICRLELPLDQLRPNSDDDIVSVASTPNLASASSAQNPIRSVSAHSGYTQQQINNYTPEHVAYINDHFGHYSIPDHTINSNNVNSNNNAQQGSVFNSLSFSRDDATGAAAASCSAYPAYPVSDNSDQFQNSGVGVDHEVNDAIKGNDFTSSEAEVDKES